MLDGTEMGTVLRALNLNPSLESLEKYGATKKKGRYYNQAFKYVF